MYKSVYNSPIERGLTTYSWTYWDGGFNIDEINEIKQFCEKLQLENASIIGTNDKEQTEKFRVSAVKFVNRIEHDSQIGWFFDKLNFIIDTLNEKYYNYNLNGYDSFQYTEYDCEKLGRYDWHMDMLHGNNTLGVTRKLSIVMNLTDPNQDYEGGKFQLNNGMEEEAETIYLPKGRVIAFPSYMIHRVTPVMTGIRKSIVIWVVGPKFI
jgi:PKHD-type hydroxylase